jgi:hypothetical protein
MIISLPLILAIGSGCAPGASVSSNGTPFPGKSGSSDDAPSNPLLGEVVNPLVVSSQSLVVTTQALGAVNKVLGLSVIQPTDTLESAIGTVTQAVLALGSCVKVDLLPFKLDFGETGCKLTDTGLTVKGKLGADLGLANGQIQAIVTLTKFEVAGTGVKELPSLPLDGTMTLSIKGLSEYGAALDLDSDGLLIAGDLALGVDLSPGISITGPLHIKAGPLFLTITLNDIGFSLTDCYPGAGTVVISESIPETMTFDETTATSGTFALTGPLSGSLTLPGYGECPR